MPRNAAALNLCIVIDRHGKRKQRSRASPETATNLRPGSDIISTQDCLIGPNVRKLITCCVMTVFWDAVLLLPMFCHKAADSLGSSFVLEFVGK